MWGGEPFVLDETYDLVRGFAEYDFVQWARIDSNLTYTKKIIHRCPSEKVKILCSWHTEKFDFGQLWERVMLLKKRNMVGMVNFVASDTNMRFIEQNNLQIEYIIKRFAKEDIFFNVAADFSRGNDPVYKEYITKYMTVEDWNHIHGKYPSKGAKCDAGLRFMNVGYDGAITSCGIIRRNLFNKGEKEPRILGNFFSGKIKRNESACPQASCRSIISYAHRTDNMFTSEKHLEDYVRRNTAHRIMTMNL